MLLERIIGENDSCVSVDVLLVEGYEAGDRDIPSMVARNSSTLADIGAFPLLIGFISTWIFLSGSASESVSEDESKLLSAPAAFVS